MAKKRVTRKKLLKEPDEFITFSAKLIRFASENRKYLQWGGGIFTVIILLVSIYNYVSIQNEKKALRLLATAMTTSASTTDGTKSASVARGHFENLVDNYSRTDAGRIAKVLYADILFKAKDYDGATMLYKQTLEDFKPEPSFKNIILSGLGHTYREKGDISEAIQYFEIIAGGSDDLLKAEALFQLGHLYENAGDSAKSMNAFEKIVSDFSSSLYAAMVKEKIGRTP